MTTDMSSVLRELEQVEDQLASSCHDPAADRLTLHSREEELRTRAARMAIAVDSECSTQDLLAKLGDLRRQLRALERQHGGGQSRSSAYGNTSPTPNASRIEQKMARIERILAEQGIALR